MNCISTIKSTAIPHKMLMKMTSIYRLMGMNDYYDEHFSKSLEYYKHKTAEDNAKDFFKFFVPDFKSIPNRRFQSLVLDSSTANNRSEQLFKNILFVFRKIHYESNEGFQLELMEIRELVAYIFNDVIETPRFRKISKKKSLFTEQSSSLREVFENYLKDLKRLIERQEVEPIFLYVNFMIDFINMRVFDCDYNPLIGTLIFYILMIEHGMFVSHYIGFFPKLLTHKETYLKTLHQTSYQWSEGLSDTIPLTMFLMDRYQDMFEDLIDLSRDFKFDQNLSILKTDFIENIVLKMPETFSKKDIRKKYPHVSDSTINRTLKRLQEENKIRSLGKGRSAKWVKIIENKDVEGQLKLFLEDH